MLQRLIAKPIHVAKLDAARAQGLARTDHHFAGLGVELEDVERLLGGNADPLPLADGVIDDAVVPPEHPAVDMDDVAGLSGSGTQTLDHLRIAAGRHEADVLAVRLLRHGEPKVARELPRRLLLERAERETQKVELLPPGGEQEIALIALLVGGAIK